MSWNILEMQWIEPVLGIVLLFFGRSLFWLFVALSGFLLGARFSEIVLADRAPWVGFLAAMVAGAAGALLAILAQRVGFALAGLFAGGYLALALAQGLHLGGSPALWAAAGGAVGAVLAALLMDWALILLSCLVGAWAVVGGLEVRPAVAVVLYLALVVVGAAFQGRPRPAPPPART